jgi:hypothetical protein
MKYKFDNYNMEIIDPTIVRLQYTGEHGSQSMQVAATLQTPDGSRFGGIDLGMFVYTDTLNDAQLMVWALAEIEKYKISENNK